MKHILLDSEDIMVSHWTDRTLSKWSLTPMTGIKIVHIDTGLVSVCNISHIRSKNFNTALAELVIKVEKEKALL